MTKVTVLGTAIAISAVAATGAATERTASDMVQLRTAIRAAKPRDVIVMKNGTWTDAQIVFDASATERAPVRLRAETPGGVILTGSSRLTSAAPYLVVEGLFFKGGFSGKNNRRPVMTNRDGARRNRVETSHFKNIAFVDENGRETIQIMGYGMSEELGE